MNKAIHAIAAMLLTVCCLRAQTPRINSAIPLTDSGNSGVPRICTAADKDGNIFFAEYYNAPRISFGGLTLTNLAWTTNNLSSGNAFVAKYAHSGDLLWVQPIAGSNGAYVSACAVDPAGNVIIGGNLNSSNTWIGTNLVSKVSASNVQFVAKLDPQGSLAWVRQLAPGAGPLRLAVDTSANIHVAGEFTTNMAIGAIVLTNQYLVSDFVAEYSSAGDLLWANSVGFNPSKDLDAIAVDAEGNTYLADCSAGTAYFPGTSVDGSGLFAAKYDATGALVWAKRLRNASSMWGIAIGAQGDLHFLIDGLVAKYDSSQNFLWSDSVDLLEYNQDASLILDPAGNTWVIGVGAYKSLLFGTLTLTSSDPNPYDSPSFVAKYDAAGNLLWAKLLDSTNAMIYASGTVDLTGSLSLIGEAVGTNSLDLDGVAVNAPTNSTDFFFAAKIPGPSVNVQLMGTQVVISWPTNAARLNLESSLNPSGGAWSPVTNAPVVVADQYSVTNGATSGSRFYRLRNF